MHPFYGPSGRMTGGVQSPWAGLASMAAYLAFWAVVVALGWRELDARFPRDAAGRDRAHAIARERLANGEIGVEEYRRLCEILGLGSG